MGFIHAYFVGRVIARAIQSKPKTAGEIANDTMQGFLLFLGFLAVSAGVLWVIVATKGSTIAIIAMCAGIVFALNRLGQKKQKEAVVTPLVNPKHMAYNAKMKARYNAKHGIVSTPKPASKTHTQAYY